MGSIAIEVKHMREQVQEAAMKAFLFICLKWQDNTWLENEEERHFFLSSRTAPNLPAVLAPIRTKSEEPEGFARHGMLIIS